MKIIVVDDHVLFREGLAAILKSEASFEIVALAGSVKEGVEAAIRLKPDILLMDYMLPDGTGIDATRLILKDCPECKIIFLTMSEDDDTFFSAIRAGAKGYLLKDVRPANLKVAIWAVAQGEGALSPSMTMRLMAEFSRTRPPAVEDAHEAEKLTPREMDVLQLLAEGRSNREIASQLSLSENTVKYHVHAILGKLNLSDRNAAAQYARKQQLLT